MNNTSVALIGFIAWTLGLLILMETIRTYLVVTGKVPANGFTPGELRSPDGSKDTGLRLIKSERPPA